MPTDIIVILKYQINLTSELITLPFMVTIAQHSPNIEMSGRPSHTVSVL